MIKNYLKKNIEKILFDLGNLKKFEKLLIIVDCNSNKIGKIFYKIAQENEMRTKLIKIKILKIHGEEPPQRIRKDMLESNLILALTTKSMAHTKIRLEAAKKGNRFLSLPDYSINVLGDQSLKTNFRSSGKKAKIMSEKLSKGKKIRIATKLGTNIEMNITNRKGNFCPGYVNESILLGSPPDIEANISPIENKSNGIIVVDGSVPIEGLGKLEHNIMLQIKNGKIVKIDSDKQIKNFLEELFNKHGENSRVLAELGFGYNKLAKINGNMLIDEGSYGTIHFGFGSNFTIGGKNKSDFHLDFVLYADEVVIDGQKISI